MHNKLRGQSRALNTLIYSFLVLLHLGINTADARRHPIGAENPKNYAERGIQASKRDKGKAAKGISQSANLGPRPGAWCGWWMRTQKGGGAEYNVARNWAKRGTPLTGPEVGAVVVWAHHVGVITGRADGGKWVVKSGNDSNRIRERARSVHDAIAFRRV